MSCTRNGRARPEPVGAAELDVEPDLEPFALLEAVRWSYLEHNLVFEDEVPKMLLVLSRQHALTMCRLGSPLQEEVKTRHVLRWTGVIETEESNGLQKGNCNHLAG